jgi:hypothetical protein
MFHWPNFSPFSEKLAKPCQLEIKQSTQKIRGIQGSKWKDPPHPRRQKSHLRGQTIRGTSSSQTPLLSPEADSEL